MSNRDELLTRAAFIAARNSDEFGVFTDRQLMDGLDDESSHRNMKILARAFNWIHGESERQRIRGDHLKMIADASLARDEDRLENMSKLQREIEAERDRWKKNHSALDNTNTALRDELARVRGTVAEQFTEIRKLKAEIDLLNSKPETGSWSCPAGSNECAIRRQCTNRCGKQDTPETFKPDLDAEDIQRVQHAILHWQEDGYDCDIVVALIHGKLSSGRRESIEFAIGRYHEQRSRWKVAVDTLYNACEAYKVWNARMVKE